MKPKRKTKSRPKLSDFKITLNAAATLLNADRRTLAKRLLAIGIETGRGQKFTVPELFRACVSEYSASRTRVSTAMAERIEAENRKRGGLVVERAFVESGATGIMLTLFSELERCFCLELPPLLVGLPERGIATRCQTTISKLKETLKTKFEQLAG
jgi:hypothetical protein